MMRFVPNLKRYMVVVAFLAVPLLNVYGVQAFAQGGNTQSSAKNRPPVTPVVDPVADKLLKDMSGMLESAKDFSFQADIDFDQLLSSGQQIQYGGVADVTVERPNKVYASFVGDLASKKIWYTGKEVTVLDVNKNFYGKLAVPATIDDTMDTLMDQYGFTLPLSDIVASDPYKSFMSNVAAGVVIGDSKINGQACKHLAFVEKYIDWQIWISEGVQKLPCKLVITYKTIPGGPQYETVFSKWAFKSAVDASVFKPVLPEGAEQIDFIKIKNQK
jgi:hypothetical protein